MPWITSIDIRTMLKSHFNRIKSLSSRTTYLDKHGFFHSWNDKDWFEELSETSNESGRKWMRKSSTNISTTCRMSYSGFVQKTYGISMKLRLLVTPVSVNSSSNEAWSILSESSMRRKWATASCFVGTELVKWCRRTRCTKRAICTSTRLLVALHTLDTTARKVDGSRLTFSSTGSRQLPWGSFKSRTDGRYWLETICRLIFRRK